MATWCLSCGAQCPRGPRCAACQRTYKRERYGPSWHAERAWWAVVVDTGCVQCARCSELITERNPDGHVAFDLGHRDGQPAAPEHPLCNRGAHGNS